MKCSHRTHTRRWSIINYHFQFMKHLLTRQGGTWHSAGQVFGSHWMWRRRPQYRHPCSQKPASHPPAGQAGYTAQQCDQGHHMLDPRYCMGTWPHLALASVRWRHRTTIIVCFSIHWHTLLPFQFLNLYLTITHTLWSIGKQWAWS